MSNHKLRAETVAIHAGRQSDPTTGAVISPLHFSTTFERLPDGTYHDNYLYSRYDTPNRRALEQCFGQLEMASGEPEVEAIRAHAFSSGMAGINAVFSLFPPKSHIIISHECYMGVRSWAKNIASVREIDVEFVDVSHYELLEEKIRPNTVLLWIETPTNPQMSVYNLSALSEIAHRRAILFAVDNTFMTFALQNPYCFGADIVFHSATKYIGGHSDILAGIVSTCHQHISDQLLIQQQVTGNVLDPFSSWMLLRSLSTLSLRVRAHSENALKVAEFLQRHPATEAVMYPGLPDFSGYELARKQAVLHADKAFFGGVISFLVRGDERNAREVCNSVQICTQATSLGGVESLIEHRKSVEGEFSTTPENLVRLSVGLEHYEDIIQDLQQALSVISL